MSAMKLNKKTKMAIISLLAIVWMAAMVGGGVYAAFSDPESTTNNTFTAGTLDLKTDDADGVTATISSTNLKPGQTLGPVTIVLKNAGTVNGSSLDIAVSYVESDNETLDADSSFEFAAVNNPGLYEKTADEFADELIVDTLTYGGFDLLTLVTDGDADGKDMKEVAAAVLTGQAGLNASATKDFIIQATLKSSIGNAFQNDGVNVTITFTLAQ